MLKAELHDRDTNDDPTPDFPTDAEIEFAEQLRRQLEELYLVQPDALAPLPRRRDDPR